MIAIDIKCDKGHVFEGWFADSDSFREQKENLLISCPYCGCNEVERLPSKFSIGSGSRQEKQEPTGTAGKINVPVAPQINPVELQKYIEKNFEDVGEGFAEEALKIYYGFEEKRNIRGTTTDEEEKELKEEGVPFVKIPIIKFDS